MKTRSLLTQALCLSFALLACSGTFAKEKGGGKDDKKKSSAQSKKGSSHSKQSSAHGSKGSRGSQPSRMTSSKPSGGGPSRASAGPSRSLSKSKPQPNRSSRMAKSGPSRSGSHSSPRVDSHREAPRHVATPHQYHPPVVRDVRPHFSPSFFNPVPWPMPLSMGVSGASVQRALAEMGFYYGPIDGVMGPMTRRAIATFQAEAGLAVTGEINGSLVRALGL